MHKMLASLVALFLALSTTPDIAVAQDDAAAERSDWLDIELGKSIVLELPEVPRAISVTNPTTADIVQLGSPKRWQVQGKRIGTTDLIIQFPGGRPPMIYEITVHRDLSDLIRRIDAIVEGEAPRVYPLNDRIVVEGAVADLDTLERVALVASVFDNEFINLMTVRGDHQVQAEVIFAEVSRTAARQMGFNFIWSAPQMGATMANGNFDTPLAGGFSEFEYPLDVQTFNITGIVLQNINMFGAISILNQYGLAKLIAQPTLTALSGQQSEFLAGGEIPIPTPNQQGLITIQYREFGTRMVFIPTVLANDVIDVQVQLEVSAVDEAVSARLSGVSIPGFTSRKVKTHVRLKSGMTFAIAGLLSERIAMTRDEVPGLGRIPVLGAFFRRVVHDREETELMVYITPRLVRPMAPGEVPPILGTTENNNPSDLALFFLGADRRAKSRTAQPTGDVGLQR